MNDLIAVTVNNKIRRNRRDLIFDIVTYFILGTVLLIVAYPLYFVIISSISNPAAVARGDILFFPVGLSLDGYTAVFEHAEVMRSFANSMWYTFIGTSINLFVTLPAAYALSRRDLRKRTIFIVFFMIPMYFSGGLIPTYLVVRNLQMIDTIWAITVPVALNVYNMLVAMAFFRANLSQELLEAAKMDGCTNTGFFLRIALPLSAPIIAILVLWYGVQHWNSYVSALIYLSSREKWPLQLVLRTILILDASAIANIRDPAEIRRLQDLAALMKYSLIIVSSAPILFLYPFIQKHFVKGVMIGSVKG